MQHLVTHTFETARPTDWASVCAIATDVQRELEKLPYKLNNPAWRRLMFKNAAVLPQHNTRDVWDWQGAKMAVLVEGWAEKP